MTRLFDVLFSLVALVALFPFMIPVMIGLKLTGENDIFYLQPRVGKGNRAFNLIKFATMVRDSPNMDGGFITQKRDPRILPMGHFLRRTKINELPQILNVLLGDMSLVGPRPVVREHFDIYPTAIREIVLSQTPGLTGIGSLVFRDEEGILDRLGGDRRQMHHLVITPYKGELEVWFAQHRTLVNYFALIVLTAWSVLRPSSSAYKSFFKHLPPPPNPLVGFL